MIEDTLVSIRGRIAQSVERWSNKPLVKGSSPFVTTFFCAVLLDSPTPRIRGRAVKALRSGRSHLWWRGFESHRMQHLFFAYIRRLTGRLPWFIEISVVGANGPYICPVLSNHSAFAGQLSVP